MKLRLAKIYELPLVLKLYEEAKTEVNCVWNSYYPTIREIKEDFSNNNLFVLISHNEVIGAASVVTKNELSDFDCWSNSNAKELARVVISKKHQGRGLAKVMVKLLLIGPAFQGTEYVHLSVAKVNGAAYKTYVALGFSVAGETFMYNNDYYLLEKKLKH